MAEKIQPREVGMCPEGRLSGVHLPSGLNGIKWTNKGRCWCVYVCVCSMCACVFGVCVWCVCVFYVHVSMCMCSVCLCVPACVHVWL